MTPKKYDIQVSGEKNVTQFLTKLKSVGTNITMLSINEGIARFRTDKKGIKKVRKYRRRYGLKVTINRTERDHGLASLLNGHRYVISFMIPFICSFFLWSVNVESEMPEVAERIEAKLVDAAIVRYRPLIFIPKEDEIRRELMKDDPSLSWVRFERVGTSLTVIPMLSPMSENEVEEEGKPSDLVARTGGVLTRFALTKGERVGHVHMTVKKGDVIATGVLEQGDKRVVVGADGAVFADYWVEYAFSIPNPIQYKIQGEETYKFHFQMPRKISGSFAQFFEEIVTTERQIAEEEGQLKLTEGMEHTVIIPLLKEKIIAERGPNATVKEDKVLHVTFDNDKVNGTILFLVNDNIAVKRPISQGD